jgi:hypothetical protein
MNDKIKELAGKALDKAVSYTWTQLDYDQIQELLACHAELIVQECAEQSMSIGRYNTPSNITPDLAIAISVGLKKHFGVE